MTRVPLPVVAACLALAACSATSPRATNPPATSSPPTSPPPTRSPATGSPATGQPAGTAGSPAAPPTSTTTTRALPTVTTTSLPAPSAAGAPAPLGVRMVRITGHLLRTTWTQRLPVFTGPGPVAAAATERARRSAELEVAALAHDVPQDVDSTVTAGSRVTVDDGRTVQVLLQYSVFVTGGAHPNDEVTTVVLRRADAAPVLLTDVFTTTGPPLAAALRHGTQVAAATGHDDPAASLSTRVGDWADWQAGPAGLTFFFDDYQAGSHAAGLRSLDVPWSLVRPWVRPEAYALLGTG